MYKMGKKGVAPLQTLTVEKELEKYWCMYYIIIRKETMY
jgi:hypothetical protein